MSKVAFGCASIETFQRRQEKRVRDGVVPIVTRFRPNRADELIGGSIYWIVKHRIVARQEILGFAAGKDRKTVIALDPRMVPVHAVSKRAHQGWRYLAAEDAPVDFDGAEETGDALPPGLVVSLSELALL